MFRPAHLQVFLWALALLAVALALRLGLMAYAMYALLGVMILSRFLARSWPP